MGLVKAMRDFAGGRMGAAGLLGLVMVYCAGVTFGAVSKQRAREAERRLERMDFAKVAAGVEDMRASFGEEFEGAEDVLARLRAAGEQKGEVLQKVRSGDAGAVATAERMVEAGRGALLANPLLDFDKLLVVRRMYDPKRARRVMGNQLGMVNNWLNNSHLPQRGWDNEIAALSLEDGSVETVFRPDGGRFVGDVDLHFGGERVLFSMPADDGTWQIFEVSVSGEGLRQLPLIGEKDIDNHDACYLPDGNVAFVSTAPIAGVPCIGGGSPVGNMYLWDSSAGTVRRLTFDQDQIWNPTVMNDGRLMFTRWEYTDTAHYFTRILFSCNPDGTEQKEFYGSNSYWPNSLFFARPVPGDATKFVGIVSGHHGTAKSGRLLLFDPSKSRREAKGVIAEIPGRDDVAGKIADRLVDGVWPQFLHPYPLSEKYFLAAGKLDRNSLWGIYLVDVFDNVTLIKEVEDSALLEPLPLRAREKPPVVPSRVVEDEKYATVYITDIYEGPGLAGVPRGAVKELRLFSYHYCYLGTGGHNAISNEGGWDVKRILGTVPVEEDGSAMFKVPANRPVSLQPLDEKGRAMQLIRSWFVGMPGENVSCVGCHESQNMVSPGKQTAAAQREPDMIEPWGGEARPFTFRYEVQPVLDRKCAGCHGEDTKGEKPKFVARGNGLNHWADDSYNSLHPYVRRPGPESDYHILEPMEYHASTSELVQMLVKGHHGVELSDEEWEKIYAWIDLNVPHGGAWMPGKWKGHDQRQYRLELQKKYAFVDDDPEGEYLELVEQAKGREIEPVMPAKKAEVQTAGGDAGLDWAFDAETAEKMQQEQAGDEVRRVVELGGGLKLKLVYVPAGEFVMGDPHDPDARPGEVAKVEDGFWMGQTEVTNAQYNVFDPGHDSRYYDQQWKDHTRPGYPANRPGQPVIRVSWEEARAFCEWLSEKTGKKFSLPSEAQWEWACRAGSAESMLYGSADTDFGKFANLADVSLKKLAVSGVDPKPIANPGPRYAFVPRVDSVDDGAMVASDVGKYEANAWGLYDMHGNVAEWTSSMMGPYGGGEDQGKKVVRGGSWRDRPKRATAGYRLGYEPWQKVYNVGFRVICED
ncbi:gliding motility-associated lipoprotein GldK [Anaerohalosphaera lusitana]|uniref:Gliding motility-associated lipoprotein GldK n=1 Tax=Anaerohalosphaera lusitana TaxID=1936003 RepID=A0A1U9NQV3_9BACT|nr:SUMF1/EgtB/PvdO family nonheme iron enzyme [Anaerohalosphaera lusitana]AQT70311.1 gliding motility-associated lipoprotein GldK [Anaerohalosphaera lusitana]